MIALIVVDMINAFVENDSPLCVAGAKETVPRIKKVIDACRSKEIPIFFIARGYRDDGSDVEVSRWKFWNDSGRPLSLSSTGSTSGEFFGPLKPENGDYIIVKKKWSAFFRTELDLILRRLEVDTVAITGTQTPNCIRATAYDADMNDFDTVIISDCISSKTMDVQEANISGCVIFPHSLAGGALWPALSCLTGLHGSTVKKVVVDLSHVSRLMRTTWFSFFGWFFPSRSLALSLSLSPFSSRGMWCGGFFLTVYG
jgi:nicotinamidase-related amidase